MTIVLSLAKHMGNFLTEPLYAWYNFMEKGLEKEGFYGVCTQFREGNPCERQ